MSRKKKMRDESEDEEEIFVAEKRKRKDSSYEDPDIPFLKMRKINFDNGDPRADSRSRPSRGTRNRTPIHDGDDFVDLVQDGSDDDPVSVTPSTSNAANVSGTNGSQNGQSSSSNMIPIPSGLWGMDPVQLGMSVVSGGGSFTEDHNYVDDTIQGQMLQILRENSIEKLEKKGPIGEDVVEELDFEEIIPGYDLSQFFDDDDGEIPDASASPQNNHDNPQSIGLPRNIFDFGIGEMVDHSGSNLPPGRRRGKEKNLLDEEEEEEEEEVSFRRQGISRKNRSMEDEGSRKKKKQDPFVTDIDEDLAKREMSSKLTFSEREKRSDLWKRKMKQLRRPINIKYGKKPPKGQNKWSVYFFDKTENELRSLTDEWHKWVKGRAKSDFVDRYGIKCKKIDKWLWKDLMGCPFQINRRKWNEDVEMLNVGLCKKKDAMSWPEYLFFKNPFHLIEEMLRLPEDNEKYQNGYQQIGSLSFRKKCGSYICECSGVDENDVCTFRSKIVYYGKMSGLGDTSFRCLIFAFGKHKKRFYSEIYHHKFTFRARYYVMSNWSQAPLKLQSKLLDKFSELYFWKKIQSFVWRMRKRLKGNYGHSQNFEKAKTEVILRAHEAFKMSGRRGQIVTVDPIGVDGVGDSVSVADMEPDSYQFMFYDRTIIQSFGEYAFRFGIDSLFKLAVLKEEDADQGLEGLTHNPIICICGSDSMHTHRVFAMIMSSEATGMNIFYIVVAYLRIVCLELRIQKSDEELRKVVKIMMDKGGAELFAVNRGKWSFRIGSHHAICAFAGKLSALKIDKAKKKEAVNIFIQMIYSRTKERYDDLKDELEDLLTYAAWEYFLDNWHTFDQWGIEEFWKNWTSFGNVIEQGGARHCGVQEGNFKGILNFNDYRTITNYETGAKKIMVYMISKNARASRSRIPRDNKARFDRGMELFGEEIRSAMAFMLEVTKDKKVFFLFLDKKQRIDMRKKKYSVQKFNSDVREIGLTPDWEDRYRENYYVVAFCPPTCSCPDFSEKGFICKHLFFVMLYMVRSVCREENYRYLQYISNWHDGLRLLAAENSDLSTEKGSNTKNVLLDIRQNFQNMKRRHEELEEERRTNRRNRLQLKNKKIRTSEAQARRRGAQPKQD